MKYVKQNYLEIKILKTYIIFEKFIEMESTFDIMAVNMNVENHIIKC